MHSIINMILTSLVISLFFATVLAAPRAILKVYDDHRDGDVPHYHYRIPAEAYLKSPMYDDIPTQTPDESHFELDEAQFDKLQALMLNFDPEFTVMTFQIGAVAEGNVMEKFMNEEGPDMSWMDFNIVAAGSMKVADNDDRDDDYNEEPLEYGRDYYYGGEPRISRVRDDEIDDIYKYSANFQGRVPSRYSGPTPSWGQ